MSYLKILLITLISFSIFTIPVAEARNLKKRLGAGLVVGSPTGLTGKYWLKKNTAVDGGIGWIASTYQSEFSVYADYLIHKFDAVKVREGALPFYYGIGAYYDSYHRSSFGIRVPVGMAFVFPKDPIELFMELAPVLHLVPSTGFSLSASFGGRYYFSKR